MPIFSLTANSTGIAKHDYINRLRRTTPEVRSKCRQIEAQLSDCSGIAEIFQRGAQLYAAESNRAALLAVFDHASHNLEVGSVSGELGSGEFPSNTPATLMGMALADRRSVHLPDISRLNRREMKPVQFVWDDGSQFELFSGGLLLALLPMGFREEGGAVLLTPFGLERSTPLGLGFIYEYQPTGAFTNLDILEARTISALFMKEIATRAAAELL